jgi:hypothetical protein
LKSTIERIRHLARLTPRERHVLLYAWLLFLVVGPALRFFPVTALLPRGRPAGAPGAWPPVDRIAWLVGVAGRHVRRRPACLGQALVLAWTLRRGGRATVLRIGVTREGGRLRAHAWLEHGGRVLFGPPAGETYEPLLSATTAVGSP